MSEVVRKVVTKEQVKKLYDDLRERVENVESSTESIAPDYYDLPLPILVGTDCIYDDERYICNTQINTSESFTPAHWTKQTVCESISLVKNAIQGLDNDKYEKPSGGIPATDMTQAVQTSLSSADSAYQKPSSGIPASDLAEDVIPPVDSSLSDNSTNAVQNKVVKGALDTKAPVIINTATGNPAVFNDGGGMPLKSLLIPFAPKQTGSGDPSPSNIRPIVPWEGLTVWNGGKNLFDKNAKDTGKGYVNNLYLDKNGVYSSSNNYYVSEYIPATQGVYTASGVQGGGPSICTYDKDKNFLFGLNYAGISPRIIAFPEKTAFCRISVRKESEDETQLELGRIASTYEEYKPITETDISFPSPVYGGTLDAVSGVLTAEWAKIDLNGTEAYWDTYNQGTAFSVPIIGMTMDIYKTVFCDRFAQIKNINSFGVYASASNDYVYFINATDIEGVTDLASWKAYLAENPMGLAYELAEPQTVQLTPAQITALLGDNAIWSDAGGSMTVEYPADTKTYINNLIATAIASL